MNIEILEQAGVDYTKGLERCLGDKELYESLLLTFLKDESLTQMEKAYRNKDYTEIFECAHSLKGLGGNLDLVPIFRAASALTDLLRGGKSPKQAALEAAMGDMREAYLRVQEGILHARG